MADEKPLTRKDFIEALKGLPTKEDVSRIVREEISTRGLATRKDVGDILDERMKSWGLATQADVRLIVGELTRDLATKADHQKMERSLKKRMGKHRTEIMTSVSKLATNTPTQKEFEELEERVERLEWSLKQS